MALVFLALMSVSVVVARLGEETSLPLCPPKDFSTVSEFDLNSFLGRWYIHQQMPTAYLPASENRCVFAEYKLIDRKRFGSWAWGYDIDVHNHAEDVEFPHAVHDSGSVICAKIVDKHAGKLEVAPCFLPHQLSGDYWVVAYSKEEGFALVSGGAPSISAPGGCRTGSGTNGSGLWIFTRAQERDEALVQKVRDIAAKKGFDLSVLNDVDNTECASAELLA